MKKEIEAIVIAAQDQALRTDWIKLAIDKWDISPKCRICQTEDESVMHIVRGCKGLAKRQYKVRNDAVRRRIH